MQKYNQHIPLKRIVVVILFPLLGCLYSALAHCATKPPLGDLSLPIQVQSDQASFEHALKQATHSGNVVLTQGNHTLHADKLVLKKDPKTDANIIVATGKPATFTGLMSNDPSPLNASADTIYFYPDQHLLVLEGKATITHEKDKFKGPSLSYQIDKQIITATASKQERPTIVIEPRQHS